MLTVHNTTGSYEVILTYSDFSEVMKKFVDVGQPFSLKGIYDGQLSQELVDSAVSLEQVHVCSTDPVQSMYDYFDKDTTQYQYNENIHMTKCDGIVILPQDIKSFRCNDENMTKVIGSVNVMDISGSSVSDITLLNNCDTFKAKGCKLLKYVHGHARHMDMQDTALSGRYTVSNIVEYIDISDTYITHLIGLPSSTLIMKRTCFVGKILIGKHLKCFDATGCVGITEVDGYASDSMTLDHSGIRGEIVISATTKTYSAKHCPGIEEYYYDTSDGNDTNDNIILLDKGGIRGHIATPHVKMLSVLGCVLVTSISGHAKYINASGTSIKRADLVSTDNVTCTNCKLIDSFMFP